MTDNQNFPHSSSPGGRKQGGEHGSDKERYSFLGIKIRQEDERLSRIKVEIRLGLSEVQNTNRAVSQTWRREG